jgi:hypothetical protein
MQSFTKHFSTKLICGLGLSLEKIREEIAQAQNKAKMRYSFFFVKTFPVCDILRNNLMKAGNFGNI